MPWREAERGFCLRGVQVSALPGIQRQKHVHADHDGEIHRRFQQERGISLSERGENELGNRNNRKDWVAFISADTSLEPEEMLRVYGKRRDIEVFFKTCKSMLRLGSECHSLSYDALNAHVSLVFTRYMLLSLRKRRNEEDRTIGEMFLLMADELTDTTFAQAMRLIVDAMLQTVRDRFGLCDGQPLVLCRQFYDRLPDCCRHFLPTPLAA